jgi:hypothetical protein
MRGVDSPHPIRQAACHFLKLFVRFDADDALEVAHHHRERMRADDRADAVDGGFRIFEVGPKGGVDRHADDQTVRLRRRRRLYKAES